MIRQLDAEIQVTEFDCVWVSKAIDKLMTTYLLNVLRSTAGATKFFLKEKQNLVLVFKEKTCFSEK